MASYNCVLIVIFAGTAIIMSIGKTTATTNSSNPVTESAETTGTMTISEGVSLSVSTVHDASTNSVKEPMNTSEATSSASTVRAASTSSSKEPVLLDCKCISRLNIYGKGNCTTKSWSKSWRGGKRWCYVVQPSDCRDVQNSTVLEGAKYSAKACPSTGTSYTYSSDYILSLIHI